jgi:hypothetical protein
MHPAKREAISYEYFFILKERRYFSSIGHRLPDFGSASACDYANPGILPGAGGGSGGIWLGATETARDATDGFAVHAGESGDLTPAGAIFQQRADRGSFVWLRYPEDRHSCHWQN